jgi:hypothetical protein
MKNKNMSHNLGSMRVIYNQKDADPRAELESIADDEGVNDLILHALVYMTIALYKLLRNGKKN